MPRPTSILTSLMVATIIAGCGQAPESPSSSASRSGAVSTEIRTLRDENVLRMRVDGVDWVADHDLFGAVHPPGMDRALIISGSRGPRDATEQAFTLNLFGVGAPGRYVFEHGAAGGSVMQLANLSPERYLIGGLMFEHRFEVEVLRMEIRPVEIEARFSGVLQANDDHRVTISAGEFRYRE
jgi:hypothetical protein